MNRMRAPEPLKIVVIDSAREDAASRLAALRAKLSPRGDIVSEAGRRRTMELFGEALSPQQVVERICRDVQERGLAAVLEYGRRLDKKELTPETLRVQPSEFEAAHRAADGDYLNTLRRIRDNIVDFQQSLLAETVSVVRQEGACRVELKQRTLPLRGSASASPAERRLIPRRCS